MVNEPIHAFKPDYAVHPGEYLAEVLEARELRKSDLADRLGVSVKHVSQIINRKEGVSADLAVRLERALGVSANIWSNLNADYSLFMARSREAGELRSRKSWLREFPVRDLIKAGWLPDLEDRGTLLEKLLEFFGISSPDQWLAYYDQRQTCFRKSGAFRDHLPHLASWLRIGELLAAGREVEAFDGKTFKEVLLEIRALSCEKPARFVPEMENLCARAGVVLVFVPEVGRTHVSGATRWLTPEKALLMIQGV